MPGALPGVLRTSKQDVSVIRRLRPTLLLVLVAALVAACHSGSDGKTDGADGNDGGKGPEPVAQRYLTAWSKWDYAGAAGMTSAPGVAKAALTQATTGLGATALTVHAGAAKVTGSRATVAFTASWKLKLTSTPFSYAGSLSMKKAATGDAWQVAWTMSDIHPKLREGDEVQATRELPDRAALLDSSGKPIFAKTDVVDVGIEPRTVTDLNTLAAQLAAALHIDAGDIVADVKAAKPTAFVPVITLRKADYLKVRAKIHDLPGTVFDEGTRYLPPTAQFGKLLLGRVGPATADVLKTMGPGYGAGDELGLSGLQAAFNKQLTGTPGVTVQGVSTTNSVVAPGGGTVPDTVNLSTVAGKAGTPVKLTIDRTVQTAADAALAGESRQASIVAIRPSDGAILAVSNSPSTTYDIAMEGQVPPGSTFKIVTATSVLANKIVPATATEPCPGQKTINGKTFHNEDSFDLGVIPLASAFAHSCNTTFATLAEQLAPTALPTTAAQFGIGAAWKLPVTTYSGQIPRPTDATELAADSIGQGRVLASPLAMALVAATVVKGHTPAPMLVAGQPAKATNPPPAPPAATIATLRTFMRATVTEGTAIALANAPGGPVSGKTGTAEFGEKTPPDSHAWFAGYQGDLAFAVFVYGGESSKTAAVPLAGKFLANLH